MKRRFLLISVVLLGILIFSIYLIHKNTQQNFTPITSTQEITGYLYVAESESGNEIPIPSILKPFFNLKNDDNNYVYKWMYYTIILDQNGKLVSYELKFTDESEADYATKLGGKKVKITGSVKQYAESGGIIYVESISAVDNP